MKVAHFAITVHVGNSSICDWRALSTPWSKPVAKHGQASIGKSVVRPSFAAYQLLIIAILSLENQYKLILH